jgi:hypothetical protein
MGILGKFTTGASPDLLECPLTTHFTWAGRTAAEKTETEEVTFQKTGARQR